MKTFYLFATLVVLFLIASITLQYTQEDVLRVVTKVLNVLTFWTAIGILGSIYNGVRYDSWKIFTADPRDSATVFGAIAIGTAIVIARGF